VSEQNLGDKLRELREKQGLSRDQLHGRTKILVRYIEALEDGRWDLLPGQAYLKPFVKSIADALNADYDELATYINKTREPSEPEEEPQSKGFDFRWLVILLLVALLAVVIFVIKPLDIGGKPELLPSETQSPAGEQQPEHAILDREYSSNMDMEQGLFEDGKVHKIELTAIDSTWLVLTVESDTIYSGILPPGRELVRESLKPFSLLMGRANSLIITYDGVNLNQGDFLSNRRRINFADINVGELPDSEK
jgi:cytoskeleton protein RodZ